MKKNTNNPIFLYVPLDMSLDLSLFISISSEDEGLKEFSLEHTV